MSDKKLSKALQTRDLLDRRFKQFQGFLANFEINQENCLELEVRLEKINEAWDDFQTIQAQIEALNPADEQFNFRSDFEDRYYSLIATARGHLRTHERNQAPPNVNPPIVNPANINPVFAPAPGLKLPHVDIPKFDGDFGKWAAFHDAFRAMIHNNPALSNVQKLFYLKSALTSSASEILDGLEIIENNYQIAWDLLTTRYQDVRLRIHHHLQTIFEIPTLNKESSSGLRELLEKVQKNVRSLNNLGQQTNTWDSILIYIVTSKLDNLTKRDWESRIVANEGLPTMTDLIDFLNDRCKVLESLNVNTSLSKSFTIKANLKSQTSKQVSHVSVSDSPCPLCTEFHSLYQCEKFKSLSPSARYAEVKRFKLCTNCLRSNHTFQNCSSGYCLRCNKKHHTLLHFDGSPSHTPRQQRLSTTSPALIQGNITEQQSEFIADNSTSSTSVALNSCLNGFSDQGMLATARIIVYDSQGQPRECRAFLDNGSQSHYISTELCEQLNLRKRKIDMPVSGIAQTLVKFKHYTTVTIKSRFNAYREDIQCLVTDRITERLPTQFIDRNSLPIPKKLNLADPNFDVPDKVDIILGTSLFWGLLCVGQIKSCDNLPILQKTKLGWIVAGPLAITSSISESYSSVCFTSTENDLEKQLEKFWSMEECNPRHPYTQEEQSCEDHFLATHQRAENGRFIVKLPFRADVSLLGDSKMIAQKRFLSVERKLLADPETHTLYKNVMKEHMDLGHLFPVSDDHPNKFVNYLPHHCVLKASSSSTKVRVVYDASSKTNSGISLNDILQVGPTIQQDLFSILVRFRQHPYVVTADIRKMYPQVMLDANDQDLQWILWRDDPSQPIQSFRFSRLTFGLAPSAFLATRCLIQLANENEGEFPEATKVIRRDFYVDDLLSGGPTIEYVTKTKDQIKSILMSGQFELAKWTSNHPDIIKDDHFDSNFNHNFGNEEIKTLGLIWNPKEDIFKYQVQPLDRSLTVTKRIILSTISKIFDPLGLVAPLIIRAKIILQKLWQLKIGWDEAIPQDLHTIWTHYVRQMSQLTEVRIPRFALSEEILRIQIHGFCDASNNAFGANIYLRTTTTSGIHHVHLLCAKSKVAPLKQVSLPKLELCGAVILSKLHRKVVEALDLKIENTYLWCDSTITLAWINSPSNQWKTFVANRVSEIQGLVPDAIWKHIRSKNNPADILSRGFDAIPLSISDLWWKGPSWLSENEGMWPNSYISKPSDLPEARNVVTTAATIFPDFEIMKRFSSLNRLRRVVAYILRFKHNVQNPLNKQVGFLTVSELDEAMQLLFKLCQMEAFPRDLKCLQQKRVLDSRSKLLPLNPYLDKGIIKVGGRLSLADLPKSQKCPIILPSKHHFVELLIKEEHYKNLHIGSRGLSTLLRLQFWILKSQRTINSILQKCIVCFRSRPPSLKQLMGNLPASRITPARPFLNTGIDYAGPFIIKISRNVTGKAYLAVFVCFASKAVHLEVVSDASTPAFLNALKRFISRRGKSARLYSDNGKNFVGANNQLKALSNLLTNEKFQNDIGNYLAGSSIDWSFIPPESPHFGGLWESAVKSAKTLIKKIIGLTSLSFEELSTVATEVEAVLNSRPLCALSNDPNDLNPLTPGHFLIGEPMTAIPHEDVQDVAQNRLNRYELLAQIKQHFWSRWSKEYLSQLQVRPKWQQQIPDLVKPGTLVLLREDDTPPLMWRMGRVVEVHPGKDGVIRVVSVKTSNNVLKRSLKGISVLPISV